MHKNTLLSLSILTSMTALGMATADTAIAQDSGAEATQVAAVGALGTFSGFNPDSKTKISHQILTDVLAEAVFPMSPATRRLGYKNKARRGAGSNISVSTNASPSRYEGNRLMIHAFSDAHTEFFQTYQQGLESLSHSRSLSTFNKDEQLAFWVNLYNVIVLNKIIEEYPISNTKRLRKGSGSFWQEKATTIEGVSLSLTDIENILFANWDSPLVIYGLWQGSIGGPTLPRQAFTGENVWALLERNAKEFVNSNRGVNPKKGRLEVSEFYEWTKAAFNNSDAEVENHIHRYADRGFMGDISGYDGVAYKYYDWSIADLVGGNLGQGTKAAANIRTDLNFSLAGQANTALDQFPPQAQTLFIEMLKEDIPIAQGPTPIVTSEECAPGEACEANPDN